MTSTDFYAVLQVSPQAELEVIKSAFKALSQKYHPDKVADGSDTLFKQINQAYQVLSDPLARARYDAEQTETAQSAATHTPASADAMVGAVAQVLSALIAKDTLRGRDTDLGKIYPDVTFDCGADNQGPLTVWIYDHKGQGISLAYLASHIAESLNNI